MRRLVGEVRVQIPNVLIGGEGCHERIVGSVPFFQMHGAPWSNMALGLLYEKDFSILGALRQKGAIKTLRLNLKDFGIDEQTKRVIRAIKS